jgi:hypothetical protein
MDETILSMSFLQVRMKPHSQISSRFSSPFFLPLSQRVMETNNNTLRVNFTLPKLGSLFVAGNFVFPETINLAINILMSILNGRWGLGLVQPYSPPLGMIDELFKRHREVLGEAFIAKEH